ncbi:hypothetical protein AC249_AIPGENE12847 [Exaiptasia diaphana]|nr:hypothetical protein AC249_AIPGENE12847 [Exaiptasia diaphana]
MKYCEVWKDDVAVQECPKTCGRCKAPSPPVGCQDEEDDCHWITDMHPNVDDLAEYCSGHRNDIAVKQCKKTCQLCNAPFPPADCKDERDDCSWITDNNPDADDLAKYCIEYRDDDAVKQCKKTCGLCSLGMPRIADKDNLNSFCFRKPSGN